MLRNRPLVALLTAEGISSLGSQMTFLALPWFVLVTTGSATKMGVVLAVEILPGPRKGAAEALAGCAGGGQRGGVVLSLEMATKIG